MYRIFLLLGFFVFLNFEGDRVVACDEQRPEEYSLMMQMRGKELPQRLLAISKNPSDVLKFLEEAPQNIRNLTLSLRNKEETLAEKTALNKRKDMEKKSLKAKLKEANEKISGLIVENSSLRYQLDEAERSSRDTYDQATEGPPESAAGTFFGENGSIPSDWGPSDGE